MRILLVDQSVSGQSALARRIQGFDQSELETLDLHVSLADPEACLEKVLDHDIVILGSELGNRGPALARQIKEIRSDIDVIVFVTDQDYSSGVFRLAHGVRARKVIPESASSLDLLQELVTIHEEFCASGKLRRGRLIVVAQAKGGVGATTIAAALGEGLAQRGARTALWDLDIESFDLSRAVNAGDKSSSLLVDWINGTSEPSQATLQDALVSLSPNAYLLPAPSDLSSAIQFVGLQELVPVTERIANLLRFSHENVIVDLAGRLGPQSLSLLQSADAVLFVVEDSILGASAIRSYLSGFVNSQRTQNLFLVGSGMKMTLPELAEFAHILDLVSEEGLEFPIIPFDEAAGQWPGQGKTLYSMGRKRTVQAFDDLINQLDLPLDEKAVRLPRHHTAGEASRPSATERIQGSEESGIANKIFGRVALRRFSKS